MRSDADLLQAFEDCSLPEDEFRHATHIRMAWLYLQQMELSAAIQTFVTGLRRYAVSLGKADLYHEAITYAYLFLVHERLHRLEWPHTWQMFRQQNPDLFVYPSPLPEQLYRPETLSSDFARQIFVLPDRSLTDATTAYSPHLPSGISTVDN
ncbi:hypothetical protein [Candidatus Entotheonella palauensis]|uniref:Uncharacterized protein n=1 Tax=Candidatus Entotheonella gemina TaxID=1429439 RepID=W4LGY3_9BACT|nr:hypothetical protein [Candidatus Entotheonella palauensis]ETW96970.1 MAG: hypothetical protein ETSY2_45465 [Candidatus Entotheonella gemina]